MRKTATRRCARSRDQMIETCAQCHAAARRTDRRFRPGRFFHDHHSLTIVDETDVFYPDGQVRDEDYEFTAFLGSKMHATGVRCVDCHEPHTAKVILPGNMLCERCHNGSNPNAPTIDPATHSFHKVDPTLFGSRRRGPRRVGEARSRRRSPPRAANASIVTCRRRFTCSAIAGTITGSPFPTRSSPNKPESLTPATAVTPTRIPPGRCRGPTNGTARR